MEVDVAPPALDEMIPMSMILSVTHDISVALSYSEMMDHEDFVGIDVLPLTSGKRSALLRRLWRKDLGFSF